MFEIKVVFITEIYTMHIMLYTNVLHDELFFEERYEVIPEFHAKYVL